MIKLQTESLMFKCHCILAMTDSHGPGSVVQESPTELGEGERPESAHVSEPPGRSVCAQGETQEEHTFCKKLTYEYTHLHHQCDISQFKSCILGTILRSLLGLTTSAVYVYLQTTVGEHCVSLTNCLLDPDWYLNRHEMPQKKSGLGT